MLNEILYDEEESSSDSLRNHEWIEIYNDGLAGLDLTGWEVTDRDGTSQQGARALPSIVLPPGNYLVVHFSAGSNDFDFGDGCGEYYTGDAPGTDHFDASMDECALYSSTGLVDFIAWNSGDTTYEPGTAHDDAVAAGRWVSGSFLDTEGIADSVSEMLRAVEPGTSIGRDKDSTDTDRPQDWDASGGVNASASSPCMRNQNDLFMVKQETQSTLAPDPVRPWTVMLYFNGDNNLEEFSFKDIKRLEQDLRINPQLTIEGGSNNDVNVVVLFDGKAQTLQATIDKNGRLARFNGTTGDAWRFRALRDRTESTIKMGVKGGDVYHFGEINMADPATLHDFIVWASTTYPAQHYALVIWDHGSGWKGFVFDDEPTEHKKVEETMHLGQLSAALAGALPNGRKFDLIGFDACYMGMLEVAYQLQPYTDFFVASEETENAPGWPYKLWLAGLKQHPAWTGKELGIEIVNQYGTYWNGSDGDHSENPSHTLSCVKEDELTNLNDKLSVFSNRLVDACRDFATHHDRVDNVEAKIALVAKDAERFGDRNFMDLLDFLGGICREPGIPGGTNPCNDCYKSGLGELMQLLTPQDAPGHVVVVEKHGTKHQHSNGHRANGLSIYFPLVRTTTSENALAGDGGSPYDYPQSWSRETSSTSHRAMYAPNEDFLPRKSKDIEKPHNPLRADLGEWPLVPTPNFRFVQDSTWKSFLDRFYHPVADAEIEKVDCPGGQNPPIFHTAGHCGVAIDEVSFTVPPGCTVTFRGDGSSDADTNWQVPYGPVGSYFWDFMFDKPECGPCKKPYDEPTAANVNDHVDADVNNTNSDSNESAAGNVPRVMKQFPLGDHVVSLHVWDDNHTFPHHRSTPDGPEFVHTQSAGHAAVVHVSSCPEVAPGPVSIGPQSSLEFPLSPVPPGSTYDVVEVDLASLLASGGDFTSSVAGCLLNDGYEGRFSDPSAPSPGQAIGYLARTTTCVNVAGTYDGPGTGQVGSRDAEIAASPLACSVGPGCQEVPEICNDGNPCTTDTCASGSCLHTALADGTSCSDGSVCDGSEVCLGGACQAEAPLGCDDGNACTIDGCDTAGGCFHQIRNCSDANPCTDDSCSPGFGCVNANNAGPCDDGNACTMDDVCSNGACTGGPDLDCSDGDLCTDDSCDPEDGCRHAPSTCDDGNACTNDSCGQMGCVHTSNTYRCDDSDPCTTNDLCVGGECTGGPLENCDDGDPCTADSCSPYQGCVHDPCDDGDPCTTDTCQPTGCTHTDACPTNDTCANALTIFDGPYPVLSAVTTDVANATSAGDPPACTGAQNSVWYVWTPAMTGFYELSTCSGATSTTDGNGVLAVYTSADGSCDGPFTLVPGGCNDDFCHPGGPGVVIAQFIAGARYYIVASVVAPGPVNIAQYQVRIESFQGEGPSEVTGETATREACKKRGGGILDLCNP